jgi:hypothetical protein
MNLRLSLIATKGGTLPYSLMDSMDDNAHSERYPSKMPEVFDHRVLNSNTAQAIEMRHYLHARDMERAARLLQNVIMPQIRFSIRQDETEAQAWTQAFDQIEAVSRHKPDIPALIVVSF